MICAYWMFKNIDGLCEEAGAWSCPATTNSFSVVSLWGLVGSSRLIGAYKALNWFIVGGLLAPIPFWLISKSFRSRNFQVSNHLLIYSLSKLVSNLSLRVVPSANVQ